MALPNPIYPLTLITVLNHVSYVGSRIVLSLYALDLGATPLTVGVLVAMYAMVQLPLSLYAGRLVDRVGHRLPMLGGSILLCAGLFAPWLGHGLPALFVSAAMMGGGFVFYNISVQALVGAVSRPETRVFNFSTLTMGYSLSSLFGPLLAGYSIEWIGYANSYAALAGIVLLSVVLLMVKSLIAVPPPQPPLDERRRMVDLLRIAPLRRMFIASGVCVTGWDLFSFYVPIYGRSIALPPSTIGVILSAFGAATFLVRFATPWLTRRMQEQNLLACALFLAAGAFAAFPLFAGVTALMVLAFVMGLGLGCGQPLTMMLTYNRSPAGRAGEANGIRQMANNVTHIFVPLFFGAIGSAFGLTPVFWTNTVFLAIGGYFSRK